MTGPIEPQSSQIDAEVNVTDGDIGSIGWRAWSVAIGATLFCVSLIWWVTR